MLSDTLIGVETKIIRRFWLNRHPGLDPGSSAFKDPMIWIPDSLWSSGMTTFFLGN